MKSLFFVNVSFRLEVVSMRPNSDQFFRDRGGLDEEVGDVDVGAVAVVGGDVAVVVGQ